MGKPLLQHTLEMVERAGFEDVLIATNSVNHSWVMSYRSSLQITGKIQKHPLGMADAVLALDEEIGTHPCIIMNAGDIVDEQLFQNLREHVSTINPYAAIVGKKVTNHVPAGYIRIEKDRVIGIVEKPERGKEPSDMINLVFHYFSQPKEFIDVLKSQTSKDDDVYEQALSQIMQSHTVTHIPYTGSWQKLKFPHYVIDMMDLFLQSITETHISSTARVSDLARINGPVFIDEQVVVHPGAVIQGPAYIGRHAIIGNNALVRHALVEEKAVIGFSSEVARSYIGPACMLHHNFIGDSILERNVNPSWGTTTGNLRLDEKPIAVKMPDGSRIQTERTKLGAILAEGVFCGINCSLMPGITMGKNARVKPGTVVYESIE
jgi:bifunctional UDP-N-acetylglucosamine pyrophosphorylase/glucosamine-1-phosphate N-acetyltransferase